MLATKKYYEIWIVFQDYSLKASVGIALTAR